MNRPTIKMWLARLGGFGNFLGAFFGLLGAVLMLVPNAIRPIFKWVADLAYYHGEAIFFTCFVAAIMSIVGGMIWLDGYDKRVVPASEITKVISTSPCARTVLADVVKESKEPLRRAAFKKIVDKCQLEDALSAQQGAVK